MRLTGPLLQRSLLFSLVGLLPAAPRTMAAAEESSFEWRAEVMGDFTVGQRGRLHVGDAVFDQSLSFPDDVRLFGQTGVQWPYFLYVADDQPPGRTLTVTVMNQLWVDSADPYMQVDLLIPRETDVPLRHNRLELETGGEQFIRRVEIYDVQTGRPDGRMGSGCLINDHRHREAVNRVVRYPVSDTERLRVRIYANALEAETSINLIRAHVMLDDVREAERESVPFTRMEATDREQEKGVQILLLDTGVANRPVERIVFDVKTPSFNRSVAVYGRHHPRESWTWLGGGEIHALGESLQNAVRISAACRYLSVRLYHYDDQPLAIDRVSLEARPRYLVFEAATAGHAALYFRGVEVPAPQYDIQSRRAGMTVSNLPIYELKSPEPVVSGGKAALIRRCMKWMGSLAVGSVSLLVLWIIVRMIHRQTNA